MTNVILEIILNSMKIFGDERRRHLSKELLELKEALDTEKANVHPDYSDAKIAIAQKHLDNFTVAYSREFSIEVNK